MKKEKKVVAILTAAGVGSRMHQDIPKQFMHIDNKPLIIYTLEAFQNHPSIDEIIVVCLEGWQDILKAYAKQFNITKLMYVVKGGSTGQESIKNGIMEAKKHYTLDSTILIHDGNRGLVSNEIISNGLYTYSEYGSSVAVVPCTEAVFVSDNGSNSMKEIPRSELYRTQTPHIYSLEKMLWAHEEADKRGITNTSATCSLMNLLGEKTYFSQGDEKNIKITTVSDIDLFKALLNTTRDGWLK